MSLLEEMNARERNNYFTFHGPALLEKWQALEAAATAFALEAKNSSAVERQSTFTVEGYTEDLMHSAGRALAPEVQEWLTT